MPTIYALWCFREMQKPTLPKGATGVRVWNANESDPRAISGHPWQENANAIADRRRELADISPEYLFVFWVNSLPLPPRQLCARPSQLNNYGDGGG